MYTNEKRLINPIIRPHSEELTFDGPETVTLERIILIATSSTGEKVNVRISSEAWEDYGPAACQDKASEKYAEGLLSCGVVTITTSDFRRDS